ncbi:hypothetical protein ABPG74_003711 [Tetrahymena malaccensis]
MSFRKQKIQFSAEEDQDDQFQQDDQELQESEEEQEQSQIEDNSGDEQGSDGEDENDSDDEQQRLEEEEKLIKEQLKHASFETIMKIKAQQKQIEMQKQQLKSRKSKSADAKQKTANNNVKIQDKRASKGAPLERSAKKPVSIFSTVISSKKQKGRDPRFDGLSGQFNSTMYQNSYKFLDDMKNKEIETLKQDIKKNKFSEQEKLVLKKELGKIKSEVKQKEHNDRKNSVMEKYKKQAKEQIQKGQMPYFAKKTQIKDDLLKVQYDKLQSEGKLEKVLKKKRKQQSDKLMSAYHLITHKKVKKD